MTNKEYKKNIWKYYIFVFFKKLSFILPIFVLFFLENGLTLTQAMFLFTVLATIGVILEIPSGVFADLYGRKLSLILGSILLFAGFFLRAAGTNFKGFLIAAIVLGVGFSFISGADSAFLYDSLKEIKKENLFKKIAGTCFFLNSGAMALGALIGGFLTIYGLRTVHYAMLIPMAILIVVSLTLKEPNIHKKIIKSNYFKHLKEGLVFSFTHKKVRNLILFSGFMIGIMLASHGLFQPYMQQVGINLTNFGWIYMILLVISAFFAKTAYLIEGKIGEKSSIILIPSTLIIQFTLLGLFPIYWIFLFLFIGEFSWGFSRPLIGHYINRHVASSHRATILSIDAMGYQLIGAILSPLVGYFADLWSLPTAFLIQAGIVVVIAIIILSSWKLRKNKLKKEKYIEDTVWAKVR